MSGSQDAFTRISMTTAIVFTVQRRAQAVNLSQLAYRPGDPQHAQRRRAASWPAVDILVGRALRALPRRGT
jgi:hypothetical protein